MSRRRSLNLHISILETAKFEVIETKLSRKSRGNCSAGSSVDWAASHRRRQRLSSRSMPLPLSISPSDSHRRRHARPRRRTSPTDAATPPRIHQWKRRPPPPSWKATNRRTQRMHLEKAPGRGAEFRDGRPSPLLLSGTEGARMRRRLRIWRRGRLRYPENKETEIYGET